MSKRQFQSVIVNSFNSLEDYLTALPDEDLKGNNILRHFSLYQLYKK